MNRFRNHQGGFFAAGPIDTTECRFAPENSSIWNRVVQVINLHSRYAPTANWRDLEMALRARGSIPGCIGQTTGVGSVYTMDWRPLACLCYWYSQLSPSARSQAGQVIRGGGPLPAASCPDWITKDPALNAVANGADPIGGTFDLGQACVPKTCAALGISCGSAPDGCGGLAFCGQCPPGQACQAGVCRAPIRSPYGEVSVGSFFEPGAVLPGRIEVAPGTANAPSVPVCKPPTSDPIWDTALQVATYTINLAGGFGNPSAEAIKLVEAVKKGGELPGCACTAVNQPCVVDWKPFACFCRAYASQNEIARDAARAVITLGTMKFSDPKFAKTIALCAAGQTNYSVCCDPAVANDPYYAGLPRWTGSSAAPAKKWYSSVGAKVAIGAALLAAVGGVAYVATK